MFLYSQKREREICLILSGIRNALLLSAVLLTVVCPFSGCQKEKEKTDFSTSALIQWFGMEEKMVLNKLDIHPKKDIQQENTTILRKQFY